MNGRTLSIFNLTDGCIRAFGTGGGSAARFGRVAMLAILLLVAAQSKAELYAGWTVGQAGTIMHTLDSGATWVRQGSGQVAGVELGGVFAVDATTAWVVGDASAAYATIYQTTDGGGTWVRKGFGQAALSNIDLGKVHVCSNHVWAVGTGAIVHSGDAGATWTNLVPADYQQTHLQGVYTIGGTTVWVTGKGTNASDYASILKSTDIGQTWMRQTGGSITQANHILGIAAADAQTLWAIGGDDYIVFHTVDGGATWTKQANPGGLGDANEVYAIDTQTVWIVTDNYIGWSTNAGQTWATHHTTEFTMGVSAAGAREAWCASSSAYGFGAVEHTADGGATWDVQIGMSNGVAPLWTISFARDPVPEPGIALLLIGLIGVVGRVGHVRRRGK